jgi:hypothetical protein
MMLRRLSLPEHGAVELLVGVALIAAPFFLGFGPAGLLASMAAGAVLAGLAISDTLPIGTHMAADTLVSAGLLAAAGACELALGMATRWTRRV